MKYKMLIGNHCIWL